MTIIAIRPRRNGWKSFEAQGVEPFFIGDGAKQEAIDYAKSRAAYRCGESASLMRTGILSKQSRLMSPREDYNSAATVTDNSLRGQWATASFKGEVKGERNERPEDAELMRALRVYPKQPTIG